jgi:hypothetical protein
MPEEKLYSIELHVESAEGTQTFSVKAKSKENALALLKSGKGDMTSSDVDVTALSSADSMVLDDVYEDTEQESYADSLRVKVEKYEKLLSMNTAFSAPDIIKLLLKATDTLLEEKGYDGHGWELLDNARKEGHKMIKEFES